MSAIFSDCGKHRLRLDRDLGREGPTVTMIAVNPSEAGVIINDMTIKKDMGFGRMYGWGRIIKVNKFSRIAKDIDDLALDDDVNVPENDDYIRQAINEADLVVGCWGKLDKLPKHLRYRWIEVAAMVEASGKAIFCFGVVADGQPAHTGRISYSTPMGEWIRPTY